MPAEQDIRAYAPPMGRGSMPGTYAEILGGRIRACRKATGLTQEDLGRIARKQPHYISQVERGKARLTVEALLDIACALGVDPAELVQGLLPRGRRRRGRRRWLTPGGTPPSAIQPESQSQGDMADGS